MSYLCDMKIIGNTVTNKKFEINRRFNLVESYDDIIPGIPTLIIGFQSVKKLFPEFNVLKHQINKNLYWTFDKNEKKDKFNQIVIEFVDTCFLRFVNDINFIYIDPIHYSKKKLDKISKKLSELKNPKGIIKDDRVIYIYGDKIIFSFDLDICEFAGISRGSIINKFKKLVGGFLDIDEILIEYGNDIAALDDSIRYLPFLYSIDNE